MMLALGGCSLDAEKDFREFQKQAKKSLNPNELQNWAVPIIAQHDKGYRIPNEELPSSVRKIGQAGNVVGLVSEWAGTKPKVLIIYWGGGFGTWGLIVGERNYAGPREDSNSRVVPWSPGVYFFRGKH
jgi:hypothetical protein